MGEVRRLLQHYANDAMISQWLMVEQCVVPWKWSEMDCNYTNVPLLFHNEPGEQWRREHANEWRTRFLCCRICVIARFESRKHSTEITPYILAIISSLRRGLFSHFFHLLFVYSLHHCLANSNLLVLSRSTTSPQRQIKTNKARERIRGRELRTTWIIIIVILEA